VATAAAELLHEPPAVASDNVVVAPVHTMPDPVIGTGAALTVTTVVAVHVPIEYEIITVPVDTPVTTPPPSTVAMPVAELLQEPPEAVSVRVNV